MSTLLTPPQDRSLGDLLRRLGDVSPDRVRLEPLPGTATEADVLRIEVQEDRLCELVEGVLVEKGVSYRESVLGLALAAFLRAFVIPRNLGIVSGESGMIRLFPGLVRIPDVAFVAWDRVPGRRLGREPIPSLIPDLVVDVLSASNTPGEMARKRREYFGCGVRLVWEVEANARTVAVYTAPETVTVLTQDQTLDGGEVLPGFELPLRELFAELDRQGGA